jgi:signal transduction histidine kinase
LKLFNKYSRYNILATILVLLLGSICYYFIIRYVLIRQLDNTLKIEEAEIIDFINKNHQLPEPANYKDQLISFGQESQAVERHFQRVDLYFTADKERKPFRQLIFPVTVSGIAYRVTVSKSQLEAEDLLGLIVIITIGIIVLLLLIQFIINRYLLRKIWTPFYETLESIKQFNLMNQKPIPRHQSDIDEFINLDAAVIRMTAKIIRDYETLRNFTDNASHEMQTPLAIINSRLDLMIQEQGLNEKQGRHLQAMYNAIGRMSQLNKSLLLLTKIENEQFDLSESLELHKMVKDKLEQLDEMAGTKHLEIIEDIRESFHHLNHYLADSMLNNLLSNAIRHNMEGGIIKVVLNQERLIISNTGLPLPFNDSLIFDRFTKTSQSEGTGLGLAIVKQICEKYHFQLGYTQDGQRHIFTITF